MFVDGEILVGKHSYVVYTHTIGEWDTGEVATDDERAEVVERIRRAFEAEGLVVEFE
jgi:hypothetical protein